MSDVAVLVAKIGGAIVRKIMVVGIERDSGVDVRDKNRKGGRLVQGDESAHVRQWWMCVTYFDVDALDDGPDPVSLATERLSFDGASGAFKNSMDALPGDKTLSVEHNSANRIAFKKVLLENTLPPFSRMAWGHFQKGPYIGYRNRTSLECILQNNTQRWYWHFTIIERVCISS